MKNKHGISIFLVIALCGLCNNSIAANYNNGTYTAQYPTSAYYPSQQTSTGTYYNSQQAAQGSYNQQGVYYNQNYNYGNIQQNQNAPYAASYNAQNINQQANYGNIRQPQNAPYAAPYNAQNINQQTNYGNIRQNTNAPYAVETYYNIQDTSPQVYYGNVQQGANTPYGNQNYNNYPNQNYGQNSGSVTSYSQTVMNNTAGAIYNMPQKANPVPENQKIPLFKNQSATELTEIVNRVGMHLVEKNNIKTPVKFIYDPGATVNAYTQIGGTITIFKGMLEYCDNGDELAAVLGHELGHATSYHGIKSTAVNYVESTTSPIVKQNTVGKISNPYLRTLASFTYDKSEKAARQYYERGQETDADLLSIDYLVAAGYNPCAFISIMNKSAPNYFDLWAGHPSTDKRIIKAYNYIKQKYPQYLNEGFDSYSYKQAIASYIK